MKFIIIALLMIGSTPATASDPSPYVAEKSNEIKSLTPDEIDGLLQGKGMGLAKAAELNQYPGPMHVLDLAGDLQLSSQQIAQTRKIFEKMRETAISLGTELVQQERELEALFSSGRISAAELDSRLLKIGATKAKLRGAHLHAHLAMKDVLTHHQIVVYEELRGYSDGSHQHEHSH